jgi:hypothetical protein
MSQTLEHDRLGVQLSVHNDLMGKKEVSRVTTRTSANDIKGGVLLSSDATNRQNFGAFEFISFYVRFVSSMGLLRFKA